MAGGCTWAAQLSNAPTFEKVLAVTVGTEVGLEEFK